MLILTKPNGGKAEALNFGLEHIGDAEIFVGIDADTVIAPDAIARLVPHFLNPKVGAVAGNAKVGNRVNLWTRWQALEYITSQNFERRALNTLGAVSVVPGAIGAWRVDGRSRSRRLPHRHRRRRCRPHHGAAAQRIPRRVRRPGARLHRGPDQRQWPHAPALPLVVWNSAGRLQASRRVRAQGRAGMGRAAQHPHLPDSAAAGLAVHRPDVCRSALIWYFVQKYFHPESTDPASFQRLLIFFVAFLVIDFIASAIAFALERRQPEAREDGWLLSQVWLQRFAYRQLFSIVLFKTLKRAIQGRPFAWDKLERTAAVNYVPAERRDSVNVRTIVTLPVVRRREQSRSPVLTLAGDPSH